MEKIYTKEYLNISSWFFSSHVKYNFTINKIWWSHLETFITSNKLNVEYEIQPITTSSQVITNYKLIDGWQDILAIIQKTDTSITEFDLTGFQYKSINPLTNLFVSSYDVEEQTITSPTHIMITLLCTKSDSPIIESKLQQYLSLDTKPSFPNIPYIN